VSQFPKFKPDRVAIPAIPATQINSNSWNSENSGGQPDGPVKRIMATVNHWPLVAREFWQEMAESLQQELAITQEEAELVAFTRIVMGYCGPVPEITVHRLSDGSWPDWTGSWPGRVNWQ